MHSNLSIVSYNSQGSGPDRIAYMNKLLKSNDIIFVQEHWLFNSTLNKLENGLTNAHVYGISGMTDTELLTGRPFGGVAIIWKKNIKCKIIPVELTSRRLCAVIISINGRDITLFNVYMPGDSYEGSCHLNAFNEVLDEISNTCVKYDTNQFIIGGDMNVDFKRTVSTHTKALNRFLIRESMTSGLQHVLCDVDYTFMSKINGNRSTIDHFLLTDNLFNTICRYRCIHEGDNLSDHSILQVELQLPVQYCTESHATVRHATTQWHKVEIAQLEQYRILLDRLLESVHVPEEVVNCTMYECGRHNQAIEQLYNGIVNACLTAGKLALPQRNESVRRAPISRWHEDVAERRDSAMWWHFIWQQNGSPNNGVVADIRRRTRAAYHYAIRYAKKQSEVIQANALADHLLNKRANDFWNEIKRIKGNTKQRSAMVDGVSLIIISANYLLVNIVGCLTLFHIHNMICQMSLVI